MSDNEQWKQIKIGQPKNFFFNHARSFEVIQVQIGISEVWRGKIGTYGYLKNYLGQIEVKTRSIFDKLVRLSKFSPWT